MSSIRLNQFYLLPHAFHGLKIVGLATILAVTSACTQDTNTQQATVSDGGQESMLASEVVSLDDSLQTELEQRVGACVTNEIENLKGVQATLAELVEEKVFIAEDCTDRIEREIEDEKIWLGASTKIKDAQNGKHALTDQIIKDAEIYGSGSGTAGGQENKTPVSTTEEITAFRSDLVKALKNVPEAKFYIDEIGNFDYAEARTDLGALEAKRLERKWNVTLSAARANE